MPKDKKEIHKEPKKKVVVVEEVKEEVVEAPKVEATPKIEETPNVVEVSPEVIEVQPQEMKTEPVLDTEPTDEVEKTSYLWIIVPTALLVGALVGGLITYFSGISRLQGEVVSTPTPLVSTSPEVVATATPEATANIDRSTIKLQVLNGSGVSGLAGKAKTYLESLGYKNVAVGNASVSNLTETTIAVKDDKKDFVKTISADLAKSYTLAKETETLPASSKYDFVITLGK